MQKKILYVSLFYAPQNTIAAVRSTKFTKYLSQKGYRVTVVCSAPRDRIRDELLAMDAENVYKIIPVKMSKLFLIIYKLVYKRDYYTPNDYSIEIEDLKMKNIIFKRRHILKPKIREKIVYMANSFFNALAELDFKRNSLKAILNETETFDFIFSSFGPISSHYIGRNIKKKRIARYWIADYRDSVLPHMKNTLGSKNDKKYIKMVEKHADVITSVSEGLMDYLGNPSKGHIVTNGFDRSELNHISDSSGNGKMRLTYCGQLYSGKRDLSYIFRALKELTDEGLIDITKIIIDYAGQNTDDLLSQSKLYNLEIMVRSHGYVTRVDSLSLQKSADALLLASWNNTDSTGIITGKFLEQLMLEKPILCTITGNLANSELKAMIGKANVGICCEEASEVADYPLLKEYIFNLYQHVILGKEIDFSPDYNYINQFSYENLTEKLISIIENEI